MLIEAAACGRAVITTDHPGCRDAITPDETGLLVPICDAEALANATQYLAENPERRCEMGRAGRKLAEEAFGMAHDTRILVTGSTGFVGSRLISELTQLDSFSVTAAVRSGGSLPDSVSVAVVSDLNAETDWSMALQNVDARGSNQ